MHLIRTLILFTLVFAVAAFGQEVTTPPAPSFWAIGVSYNPGATPAISGTGLYAKLVSPASGTYSFSVIDALPLSVKPFTVSTQISTGVAQKIVTIRRVTIFVPVSVGISYSGQGSTGWAWTSGGMADCPIGNTAWKALPNVRVVKSSVSNGADYQLIVGVLFGR